MKAIEWIVTTVDEFDYPPEVTCLGVRLMDLYWSKQQELDMKIVMQMACAAFLVAAKMQVRFLFNQNIFVCIA